ncbi:MAG: hypothetical protein KAW09_09565, partial [Thermoplasmata archaeon]|nr:hypothetical protein [Thermoplasmata archaeon]
NDRDGVLERMVKFDRSEVQELLSADNSISLTITGRLYDGTEFEGSDRIRVVSPPRVIQSDIVQTLRVSIPNDSCRTFSRWIYRV